LTLKEKIKTKLVNHEIIERSRYISRETPRSIKASALKNIYLNKNINYENIFIIKKRKTIVFLS